MAFPAVQTRSTGSANAASLTVVLPSGSADTDLIIILLMATSTGTTWAQTSGTTGWTELNDTSGQATLYKQIGASESNPSFDLSGGSERSCFVALRITGHEDPSTQAPQRSVVATSTSTTPNPIALSPTGGAKDYLWIPVASYTDGRSTFSSGPTNYTDLTTVNTGGGANGVSAATAERQLNTANEDPGVFTAARSELWVALTIAVHPSAAAAATVGVGLTESILLEGKLKRLVG